MLGILDSFAKDWTRWSALERWTALAFAAAAMATGAWKMGFLAAG
jgi:hypothetical protein